MWPFKKKALIAEHEVEWQFATYQWLLENFGGYEQFKSSPLILPTPEFFPAADLHSSVEVVPLFDQVKLLAGMENWPTALQAQEERPDFLEVQPGVMLVSEEQSPCGTFSFPEKAGEPAVISYKPSLADKPIQLIATFAHELGHYLTADAINEPPGGWEAWEITTDLTAVFFGFGVFNANSAFSFAQFSNGFSQGWHSERSGYLSETSLLFALAIFVKLTEANPEQARTHLKPSLRPIFDRARNELQRHSDKLAKLKTIKQLPAPEP